MQQTCIITYNSLLVNSIALQKPKIPMRISHLMRNSDLNLCRIRLIKIKIWIPQKSKNVNQKLRVLSVSLAYFAVKQFHYTFSKNPKQQSIKIKYKATMELTNHLLNHF